MLSIKMKTIVGLVLFVLMKASAAPTRKAECQDQYRHCPEWSRAGYCAKTGYKTYMTFMCAYSCNTCQDQKLKESQDLSLASGLQARQLQNPEDIHETTFEKDEDEASANEPVSGEGEIRGDSEDKEEDKVQHEQSKDATLEWQNKGIQPTERQQRQNISGENEEATHKQAQNEKLEVTQDQDPPGVHVIQLQDNNIDDDVNPRSKISTRPNENPKPLIPQTRIENTGVTKGQGEDVSASGSMLDESGDSEGDESNSASPVAEPKGISEESQEMKDIAGDIKAGSKIFEADISEPDSASGCSSGFGCSSGNEEEIQTEKNQEAVELEPRSKIATAPQIKDAKSQQADKNNEIEHGQTSAVNDTASGSVTVLRDDVAPEDDIAGAKSEAKSTTKITQTQEDILERAKTVKEDGEMSAEIGASGSGGDVYDDIQGQSVHGENDESIVGGKSAANGAASTGSGADTTSQSEQLKQIKTAAKSYAEIKQENGQKQEKTAKSEPADKESIAESNAKNEEIPWQNEAIKNATFKSISLDQNQSESENDADDDEKINTDKEVIRGNNETSKAMNEYEMRKNKKEGNQQQDDNITKSATDNPSAAKNDVDRNELVGQKYHVRNTGSGSQPTENSKLDADYEEDDTKTHTEAKPKDNENGADIDTEYIESDEKINVKDQAVETNENQEATQSGTENDRGEQSDTFSGSGAASIDANIDTDRDTQPTDIDEIEDALFSKEDKSIDNQKQASDENHDLSSPAAKQRITSMEKLIKDDNPKVEKVKDALAKTRENVPSANKTLNDFINTDLGKGRIVSLILDQHYYKPYSNEDSMAYEMLALDLKKEVERAVGNQAIVSQISFSEIRKPGKLPRYSRVLAKFMLHGDMDTLHGAVRKGVVGDLMVDKKFFQAS